MTLVKTCVSGSESAEDFEVIIWKNTGAQVNETVTVTSNGYLDSGTDDFIKILVTHNGIPGDSSIELASWI